jgi:hypothetical protein
MRFPLRMRSRTWSRGRVPMILGFACVAWLCVAAPASARASVNDVAATRAYLRASEVYARSVHVETGAMVGAINARENEVASRCPYALAYAPRDAAFSQIGEEMGAAQWYASQAPMRSAALKLTEAIGHLGWSDRRLTRLVRARVVEERADTALVLPDVCSEIGAWKASAYATLPRGVSEFLAHVEADESGSVVGPSEESREAVIAHLLKRYEGPAESQIAKRAEQLEKEAGKRLGRAAVAAERKLATAMGVSQL